MHLYFLRHAIACEARSGETDFDRELTSEGITRTRHTARLLKVLGVEPDRLYTSPLIRARQTADIIGQTLGVAVQVRGELSPGFDASAVEALIRDVGHDDDVMFVGHEPDFSLTISALTGGSSLTMKKGGLARVDVTTYHPLCGELVWLIAPKVFKRLG